MDNFVKRTVDVTIDDDIGFESLLLSPKVLLGLKAVGFDRPSPIQLQSIPLAKCGADLVCQAKSGTGKTCVFAVAALESINLSSLKLQVLVLAPTREIAHQICDVVTKIGREMKSLKCSLFIGGMPIQHDVESIKSCHIAIGTPGRIKGLIESNIMLTKSIRLFVLDEADKLLEEGFQEQINWIYSTLPKQKQVLALSATYPQHLAEYLSIYMNEPIHVRISTDDLNLKGVRQMFTIVKHHALPNLLYNEKCEALLKCIENVSFDQCMVFSNYQSRASHLCTLLNKKGWPCTYIAGSQLQPIRLKAISELKSYNCRILVTTDLSARGIDCDKVNLVINLDMPWDTETYLHRVGRAGRFGTYGLAISIVSGVDEIRKLFEVSENINCDIVQLPDDLSQLSDMSSKAVNENTIKSMSEKLLFNKANTNTVRSNQKENRLPSYKENIKKDSIITLNPIVGEQSFGQNFPNVKEVNGASELTKIFYIEDDNLLEAAKTLSIHDKKPNQNCVFLDKPCLDINMLKITAETDVVVLNQESTIAGLMNKHSRRCTTNSQYASNDNLLALCSLTNDKDLFQDGVTDNKVSYSSSTVDNVESVSSIATNDKELPLTVISNDSELPSTIATNDKKLPATIATSDKELPSTNITNDKELHSTIISVDKVLAPSIAANLEDLNSSIATRNLEELVLKNRELPNKETLFKDKLPKYLSLFSNRSKINTNLDSRENPFLVINSVDNPTNVTLNTVFTKSVPDKVKVSPTITKFNPMATCLNLMDFTTFSDNNQMAENRIEIDKCNDLLELPQNDCNVNYDDNDNESECFEYTARSREVDHKSSSSNFSQSDHSDFDDHNDSDSFTESLFDDKGKLFKQSDTDHSETSNVKSLIKENLDFSSNISVYEYSSGVQHLNHISTLKKSASNKPWNQLRFVECFGQAYLKHISEIIRYQTKYQDIYKQE